MGVKIKRVTKTGRGVMIETEGAEQLEKISNFPQLKEICSHCAGEHDLAMCQNKERPARCANCVTAKRMPIMR